MRALVTGANGFLGTWLTRRLVDRGDQVRCLVRKGADAWGLEGLKIEIVNGDVTDASSLPAAVKGADVVFHLAGIRRAPTRELFFQVNAEGTRLVAEAMAQNGARRLVLCGSLAANGPSTPDRPRREEDPFAPEEWYGESKAEAERILFSYQDKLEVTACRPSRIVGPGDRENLTFFKVVKRGVKLKISGGPRPISMVDAEDVVDHLLLLGDKKAAVGEAFFASSDETVTLESMQDVILRHFGWKARTVPLNPTVLRALGGAADVVSQLTGKHLPLNRKLARQLLAPAWTCSIDKSKRLLGYAPKNTVEQSIIKSADWYREKGWI